MNVNILGQICLDINTSENASYKSLGGSSTFMDKVFTQIPDTKVKIISPYGKDFLKLYSLKSLLKLKNSREKTLIYKNVVKNKKRFQKALNTKFSKPTSINKDIISLINKSDIIFFAPIAPNYPVNYVEKFIKYAPKKSLKIILPQGYFRKFTSHNDVKFREFKEADKILKFFDVIIVSEQDHPEIYKLSHDWVEKFNNTVIVTKGENGAIGINKKGEINVPAKIVNEKDIIDSTGSGDIFSAAFGYKFFKTRDVKESIEFANEIARQCLFFKPDEIKIKI